MHPSRGLAAPGESRSARLRYVPAAGAARGIPPPAPGCGRSADSRSRYVSGERGQAGRGAKPRPARPRGYLLLRGQLRAQAPWAWPPIGLGAWVAGDCTLAPGGSLAILIASAALSLQRGCSESSRGFARQGTARVTIALHRCAGMLRFSLSLVPGGVHRGLGPSLWVCIL